MELKEIINKDEWEGFLEGCVEKTFLQSWNWGEFSAKAGNKIWRFGVYDSEKIMAVALVVKVSAKRGTFLFIPHGPVFSEDLQIKDKKEILELLMLRLYDIAGQEKASFVRIPPLLERTPENENFFIDLNFSNAPMHASAYESTWKMDIYPSEEELLKNMRETTRYLVKKTAKNPDISVQISSDSEDIAIYQKLNKEVSKRQKFAGFPDQFIKNEFEIFSKDRQAVFIFGRYKGEVAAGALIIFWQGIAFYHQAASRTEFSKISIPYLLQWEAIKLAKSRNCLVYDFWGFTDPKAYPKHPWAGPSLFKTGFGGYKKEYVRTQDFAFSWRYWINYIIEKARKFKRGL